VFQARATALPIEGAAFLLLTLQDVSAEARRAMLERSFLHDFSSLVVALQAVAEQVAPLGDAAAEEGGTFFQLTLPRTAPRAVTPPERAAPPREARRHPPEAAPSSPPPAGR